MQKYLIGSDWGTSSFRLRLFDIDQQIVIAEVTSEEGIAKMHTGWQHQMSSNDAIDKIDFFRNYLKKEIDVLSAQGSINLQNSTIVISGMASSSIGMEDVPYAKLPFALNGSNAAIKSFKASENLQHEIILISGVRSENDVMRGEETQLIGLMELLKNSTTMPQNGMLIFPGTHSKHIRIKNGSLVSFSTFMTGEVYSLMSKHSILKDSVQKDNSALSEAEVDAFKLGVAKSKEATILHLLFTVRANQLFNKLDKKQNACYLSGLLIGEELNYFLKNEEIPLVLCSASNLAQFYTMAIEALDLLPRATIVSSEIVNKAALAGQLVVYQKHPS
ncbi:MAG: 2-dehydro-3-deoxygalactonokinase, partial [Bacteroidota bacterium]|nr:2-dehydro-3-deoxygalactonokinase [Bacteroidota bacterium]